MDEALQLKGRLKVAFDTNMLLSIAQHKVDVVSEARKFFGEKAVLAVPEHVMKELEELKKRGKTMEREVEIALEQVESHGIKVVGVKAGNADNALEEMARQGYFVATNDSALRKRIKGFGGKVIYLRQLHFLKSD